MSKIEEEARQRVRERRITVRAWIVAALEQMRDPTTEEGGE